MGGGKVGTEAVSPCYPGPLVNIRERPGGYRVYSIRHQRDVFVPMLRWVRFPLGAPTCGPDNERYTVHDYSFSWLDPTYQSVVLRTRTPGVARRVLSGGLHKWRVERGVCGHAWSLEYTRNTGDRVYNCVKCGDQTVIPNEKRQETIYEGVQQQ